MGSVVLELKYLVRQIVKGREYFYFRRGKIYRRLPHPTDPTFQLRYDRALKASGAKDAREPAQTGTFGHLVERYIDSPEFKATADKTRYERRRFLDLASAMWRDLPAKNVGRGACLEWRDTMADTPRKANYAMQTLRRLFNFGIDRGLLGTNPVSRPGRLKEGDGHKPWPETAIAKFRADAGDATMVLAMEIGLYTGQRRGDVIKMTRHDYDGRLIAVVQNKGGEKLWIPVHSKLKAALDGAEKAFMLLVTKRGKKFTETRFSHQFHKAVVKAGLDGLTFHGLRATAANHMAEAGCTELEIGAVTGHRTLQMIARYTRDRNRKVQAEAAIAKLEKVSHSTQKS